MTDRLRNLTESNWDYYGDPRVGIPSAEIPIGILKNDTLDYPNNLLRRYVTDNPSNIFIEEDGSFTYTGDSTYIVSELYVDGEYVDVSTLRINPDGTVSGLAGGTADVYNRPSVPPQEDIDLEFLDRILNAPEWDNLPMEDQKEFSYYSKTNPTKTRKVIYLIRRV